MVTRCREAVLLAGGRGTRLRPLTVHTPKPMLPTAGVPFLHHRSSQPRAAGDRPRRAGHVVPPGEVFGPVSATRPGSGLHIDYVTEDEPLGTGGGSATSPDCCRAVPTTRSSILNGDVLSGHDLATQIAVHLDADADVTLHLTEVDDPRAFGCVPTDDAAG